MELKDYIDVTIQFLKEYKEKHPFVKGYVLGLSGGVDSSLVSVLTQKAVGNENMMNLILPIESNPADVEDALYLCKEMNLPYKIIDCTKAYLELKKSIEGDELSLDISTLGNLKARIRMSTLYAYAQKMGYLVVGTDNADERYTGYFTKYGDGGVDILPIAHLLKREVVEASKILGIPDRLADRVPTAGLFEGQTDEREMGVLYKDLDDYLLGKDISHEAKVKIEKLHATSEHKRIAIPTPKEFNRD